MIINRSWRKNNPAEKLYIVCIVKKTIWQTVVFGSAHFLSVKIDTGKIRYLLWDYKIIKYWKWTFTQIWPAGCWKSVNIPNSTDSRFSKEERELLFKFRVWRCQSNDSSLFFGHRNNKRLIIQRRRKITTRLRKVGTA